MKGRILSLDPGHITGVACFSEQGGLDWSMTVLRMVWEDPGFLPGLAHISQAETVLIEGLPSKQVDSVTANLFHYLKHWFHEDGYEVVVVRPSEWKGLVSRVEIAGGHARDAATMGRWYLSNHEKEKS